MTAKKSRKTEAPASTPKKARKGKPSMTASSVEQQTDMGVATEGTNTEMANAETVRTEMTAPADDTGQAEPVERAEQTTMAQPSPEEGMPEPPLETPTVAIAEVPMLEAPLETPARAKKRVKKQAAKPDAGPQKVSALDAAARVLAEAGQPMNCLEMIEAMASKGYWESPKGKTPQATLYAAILREIGTKGNDARFAKTERGKFARRETV